MTIELKLNHTYRPADPEWAEVIVALREGDEVEVWWEVCGVLEGRKGSLWAHADAKLEVGNYYLRMGSGDPMDMTTELTITALVPREPEWAGARVILDRHGDAWNRVGDGRYRMGALLRTAEQLASWGPVTVLVDANGHIPVDSVLSVNGVTRDELVVASIEAAGIGKVLSETHHSIVALILAALAGGAR